jgi:hypothetical protein
MFEAVFIILRNKDDGAISPKMLPVPDEKVESVGI